MSQDKSIDQYQKKSRDTGTVTTSVTITKEQHDFFRSRNTNLSLLVRDLLEKIMKQIKAVGGRCDE